MNLKYNVVQVKWNKQKEWKYQGDVRERIKGLCGGLSWLHPSTHYTLHRVRVQEERIEKWHTGGQWSGLYFNESTQQMKRFPDLTEFYEPILHFFKCFLLFCSILSFQHKMSLKLCRIKNLYVCWTYKC